MLNKSVARRYAEAFFSIAQETGKVDQFQQELEKVVQIISETEHLQEYLDHLLIPPKEKKELVGKIFTDQISSTTLNFISMIIDKRRGNYIGLIVDEYKVMADETRNIAMADIISAREVSEEDIKILADKLSASTGKTVQLKLTVDPTLLGGVKIRMGDQVIDATVAKKLDMLREQLKQVKIS
ncbi:MAG: F0F1 ATP synthase subunit delta [Syntrophomonadaceae bacterium]|nr:F0F1 ATP synthase subunit delta [Syntrophomonadaceae bacterium]